MGFLLSLKIQAVCFFQLLAWTTGSICMMFFIFQRVLKKSSVEAKLHHSMSRYYQCLTGIPKFCLIYTPQMSAISPDGSHILSGSEDGNAYLWRVNKPESAPVLLRGHEKEVTAVAWCSTEVGKLATSSDDYMVRVWNIKKESCISTRSPYSMNKRVTATPRKLCRKLNMDETESRSKDIANRACISVETMMNSPSPLKTNLLECATPKTLKRRKLGIILSEGPDMQRPPDPEAAFDSPSSVLNPPSSSRRRTIRDYFVQPSETIKSHLCD
ncbi:hypothetical protein KSP40_PGU006638 [Platanthera guangdongensis]|uniref:Uncharacterized protein n=1 Tax=Platanthera guangdongensis TaxID=2320717 RepID=A0ABR2LCU1_9ASPA